MSAMSKVIWKSILLLVPLLAWQLIELFALPMDAFTFRPWETLLVKRIQTLPGPFYPNQDLIKWSAGDKNPSGVRNKLIRFQTDNKGFRNKDNFSPRRPPSIVVIGDSNIVGSHTDQHDLFTEQLSHLCKCVVFNAGSGLPTNLYAYMRDSDFKLHNPEWVVLEFRRETLASAVINKPPECPEADRFLSTTLAYTKCDTPGGFDHLLDFLFSDKNIEASIFMDRVFKQPAYNLLRARLGLSSAAPTPQKNRNINEETHIVKESVANLLWYQDRLAERGSRLAILILGGDHPEVDRAYGWVTKELKQRGIPTLDVVDRTDRNSDLPIEKFWYEEDSHWTDEAIRVTALDLFDTLVSSKKSKNEN